MRWDRLLLVLLLGGLAVGCRESRPGATAADVLGGEEVVETMRRAESVDVFRLKDRGYSEELEDYEGVEGPLRVERALAQELADIVTAWDSYDRDARVSCAPIYHVRTRFVRGDSQVDVVYCFECCLLTVFHNEELVGGGHFAPVQRQMNRLAKRLLPEDEALQKLE